MEERLKKTLGSISPAMAALLLILVVLVMLPEASATRYIVGGNMGWTSNVNYTNWAKGKHFYNGDWLCKLSLSHSVSLLPFLPVTLSYSLSPSLSLYDMDLNVRLCLAVKLLKSR